MTSRANVSLRVFISLLTTTNKLFNVNDIKWSSKFIQLAEVINGSNNLSLFRWKNDDLAKRLPKMLIEFKRVTSSTNPPQVRLL